jgi:hypothetical protein
MRVHCVRTAIIGGGCSYDVYVPQEEIPRAVRPRLSSWIVRDSRTFANYPEATLPPSHFDMPTGLERWDAWRAHAIEANRRMLTIAERAFPELATLRTQGIDCSYGYDMEKPDGKVSRLDFQTGQIIEAYSPAGNGYTEVIISDPDSFRTVAAHYRLL